jgi:Ala-tRNA(Pro) deacylase
MRSKTNNEKEDFKEMARAEENGFPINDIFQKDAVALFENRKEPDMPIRKLRKYLDENKVKYVVVSHSTAYTSQETAERAHISGKEMAKTVMVKLDGKMTMVVIPTSSRIEMDLLKEVTGAEKATLASELEFERLFPDCELGAMPPFGNLYDIPVYVAKKLKEDKEIAFNAGNHRELIRMTYADFEKLVKPKIIDVAYARA